MPDELLAYVEAVAPSHEELLRYLEARTVTVEELETPSLLELLEYLEARTVTVSREGELVCVDHEERHPSPGSHLRNGLEDGPVFGHFDTQRGHGGVQRGG